ncbi:MAG: tetratricopeptide repeat protein [Planctomycetes bacterium]|nr:tetratricopeptide repeat protein [Planctomycetota bacterium]
MPQQVTEDPRKASAAASRDRQAEPGELWCESPGVRRFYSAAMMAEVLGVPPAAVRHWIRVGLLAVAGRPGALEQLDFGQLVIGRHLAKLLARGLSLREIDAKLAGFAPGGGSQAANAVPRVVADGRRLSIAHEGRLLGAGGQLQFTFYTEALGAGRADGEPAARPIIGLPDTAAEAADPGDGRDRPMPLPAGDVVAEILDLADDLEAAGEYVEAAEALRAVLQAQGPTAAVTFTLAELLYRAGDLTAARERYYATLELDPDHLRARASLGCVLGELGEPELALAALEGVLRQEPDDADAHWHAAGILADMGRQAESRRHLRRFLGLAPQSPWAALARARLDGEA